jgi:ABC-type bacteriocin/lantibiotic exporter with double-glycine peptidase domain
VQLPVPHCRQLHESDCLAACASMLLEYYNLPTDYSDLLSLLEIGPIGAPRRNISRLSRLGIVVDYREATLPVLYSYIQEHTPVIAFVDTGEISYWQSATNHALVVVGLQDEQLLVNDPAFEQFPQQIPADEFELAWLNADYMCATLRKI